MRVGKSGNPHRERLELSCVETRRWDQYRIMTTKFSNFSTASAPVLPLLPFVHTTDWETMVSLIETAPTLEPTLCPVFNEDLLYLFYGRPSFRKHAQEEPNSIKSFDLVCLLMDSAALPAPKRVFPFDSGAFAGGIYKDHLHPRMKLEDFEIDPTLEAMARFVGTYFGENKSYYNEVFRESIPYSPRETQVDSFLSIVRATGTTRYDDRRSAIEIQFERAIDLLSANVLAVIAPEDRFDDPLTLDFVVSKLNAEPLGYYCPHARPLEDARSIVQMAKDFYKRSGIL